MCGTGLSKSTVGIVGLGRIGCKVAECLKPFDVSRILYTSRTVKQYASKFNGEKVELDKLLEESDFVIVTIALTQDTRELFNTQAFEKMKKSAIFINASRGEVVNQKSLIEALKKGTIKAAGLDVMTPEPIPLDSELLKLDNCGMNYLLAQKYIQCIYIKNYCLFYSGLTSYWKCYYRNKRRNGKNYSGKYISRFKRRIR